MVKQPSCLQNHLVRMYLYGTLFKKIFFFFNLFFFFFFGWVSKFKGGGGGGGGNLHHASQNLEESARILTNNTALIKQISPVDTALDMPNT